MPTRVATAVSVQQTGMHVHLTEINMCVYVCLCAHLADKARCTGEQHAFVAKERERDWRQQRVGIGHSAAHFVASRKTLELCV